MEVRSISMLRAPKNGNRISLRFSVANILFASQTAVGAFFSSKNHKNIASLATFRRKENLKALWGGKHFWGPKIWYDMTPVWEPLRSLHGWTWRAKRQRQTDRRTDWRTTRQKQLVRRPTTGHRSFVMQAGVAHWHVSRRHPPQYKSQKAKLQTQVMEIHNRGMQLWNPSSPRALLASGNGKQSCTSRLWKTITGACNSDCQDTNKVASIRVASPGYENP